MSTTLANLQQINSTSFVDVLGLSLGLTRFSGEDSYTFALRIASAAARSRNGSYEGAMGELCAQLGLAIGTGISIESQDPTAVVLCGLGGLGIVGANESISSALLTTAPDTVWSWRNLSDIVADINKSHNYTAGLLVNDAPAIQLCAQTNQLYFREPVLGQKFQLSKTGFVTTSIQFDTPNMPAYVMRGQTMTFASAPPEGASVIYQYISWPFNAVTCEAG